LGSLCSIATGCRGCRSGPASPRSVDRNAWRVRPRAGAARGPLFTLSPPAQPLTRRSPVQYVRPRVSTGVLGGPALGRAPPAPPLRPRRARSQPPPTGEGLTLDQKGGGVCSRLFLTFLTCGAKQSCYVRGYGGSWSLGCPSGVPPEHCAVHTETVIPLSTSSRGWTRYFLDVLQLVGLKPQPC
jgi:hypothetical protein